MSSQPPTSGSMAAPSGQGTGYEDIDSFINYDPTVSPTVNTGAHSTPTAGPSSSMMQPSNSQHSFPAPTHQYDQHKQQTGLVMGAIASTLAVNQGSNVSFGRNSGLPTFNSTDFFGFAPDEEMINFNTTPAPGMYNGLPEMDMEFDTPTQESISTLFYPPEHSMSSSSYINPTAMGGQETASPVLSTHGNVGRLYPGMHQQQAAAKAAQAHAQAQARRQQLLRQQTQNQQRIQAVQQMPQQPLPSNMTHNPNDPMVQETISHLLSSMRQSSVVSSNDDEGATPSASNMLPHIARSKKDEEDMDEDERLLASEEGKKLSSKERRQLRNKVSARAFRSRRKEYIGQLEAEIAAKTSEANDLRVKNRALLDENTRLSDLTRMLLSSPQFQDFIQTMSTNNPQISQTLQQQLNGHPLAEKDVKPNPHKDVNPYQAQQSGPQTGPLVGMAMVPEPSLDFSNMNMQPTTWAGMAPGAFASNRPQVFSVLELPQGPAVDSIDTTALSGKTSGSHTPLSTFTSEVKDQLPELPLIPRSDSGKTESVSCEEMAEYDPEFPLYAASPEPSMGISSGPREPVFGNILPEKALARYELVSAKATTDSEVSTVTMARFEYLFRSMDVTFERIGRVTAHLPTQ